MLHHPNAITGAPGSNVSQLSALSSLLLAVLTLTTFIIAYFTPPLSGPLCVENCYQYPYYDTLSRIPRDYYWMYPAILLQVVYAVWIICIHYSADPPKRPYSGAGLYLGLSGSVILMSDYFLQVSVVPQSLAKAETEGIALITQFNPHGIFIALEELGYLLIGASFLFFSPIFYGNPLQKAIRYSLIVAATLSIAAFGYFSIAYGMDREYRFELAAISIVWLELIIAGILTANHYRRSLRLNAMSTSTDRNHNSC